MPLLADPFVVGSTQNKTSQATTVVTTTVLAPAGTHLAVFVGSDGDGVPTSCTDSAGNTYATAFNPAGGSTNAFVRLTLFVAKNIAAIPAGGTITIGWGAGSEGAAKGVIAVCSPGQDPTVDWAGAGSQSGGGPTAYSTVVYPNPAPDPYPPEGIYLSAVVLEGANSSWTNGAGFVPFPRAETSGQGSASNIKLGVAWYRRAPLTNSNVQYSVTTDSGVDYSAGGVVFEPAPVVITTLSRPVAWSITKRLQAPVEWSIPQRLSAPVAWAIAGDGSYTPAPVLVESFANDQLPYTVELPVKSYSSPLGAETLVGRERLYPTSITGQIGYSGSLSAVAELPDPATDPTWMVNTNVGTASNSQLKVRFPITPANPHEYQIFSWTARLTAGEPFSSAAIYHGYSKNSATPISIQTNTSVGASPITYSQTSQRGLAAGDTIDVLLQAFNSNTGVAPRGAFDIGGIAWDFIHHAPTPKAGREVFIVSKSASVTLPETVLEPILITSSADDGNSYAPSPLQVESRAGVTATLQVSIRSVAQTDGEEYDLATPITSEATLVEFDIQFSIAATSAARVTPELPIEAASAVPTANPALAVESATSNAAVTAEIMVTSSARDSAIYPGLARTMTPYLTVGGVDLSSRLSGPWSVTREEGRVGIAEISLRPQPGVFDVSDAIRSPVRFGYRIDGADPVILFTGIVDEPAYDPHTRSLVYVCTDNLTRVVGALPRAQIDALTPGAYWSPAAAPQDADGWDYAQARMDTVPASLDLSIDGQPRMHAWAAAATPNFVFRDDPATGNFVDRTLRLSRASWREFVNEITLTVETRYQRRVQRDVAFNWSYTPTFQGYLTDTSPLPTEDTVRAAAEQAGWAIKSESFERLPPSGVYFGIIWTHNPDNPPFWILEAHLTLARRWDETITERTTYTVRAPASVARFGAIKEADRITYRPDPPADTDAWLDRDLDQRASSGAIYSVGTTGDLDGFTAAPGGVSYRDDTDPAATTAAHMVGLTRAARRILEAHRQHTAEVTSPLLPEIDTIHTAEVQATGLTYTGKVREVIHRGDTDIAAGPPTTTIRIALSQCDGAASVTSTPLAPAATTVPAPDVLTGQPALGVGDNTHLGNRWYSPPEDPAWDGWISNYTIPQPVGATKYDERFVVDVGEYSREPVEVTASATFDVDVPHDPLLTTA